MRKIIYPYSAIGSGDQVRLRPSVDVVLIASNGESLTIEALADTGADSCLFPLYAARMLGLSLEGLTNSITTGVGNAENFTYFETLTIDLGNGVIFETQVGFTEGMDRAGFGLLGQQGFFENFDVEFRHRRREFTIEPSS